MGCENCNKIAIPCLYTARQPRQVRKAPQGHVRVQPLLPAVHTTSHEHRGVSDDEAASRFEQLEPEINNDDLLVPKEMCSVLFQAREKATDSSREKLFTAPGKSRIFNSDKVGQVCANIPQR
jgi:hypothetical protein